MNRAMTPGLEAVPAIEEHVAQPNTATAAKSARLVSLDAFRGFTIASMVLVNNPGDWGSLYKQLGHAKWNGWTFTDWIFPFFLFIGGISMTMSLGKRAEAGDDKPALLRQLAKRAGIIFLLGFLLNLIPHFDFAAVRIPGVLQRIAICTLVAAPIVVYFDWRQQLAWIVGLFAVYSVLMLFVPVPDAEGRVAAGVLEPGRDFGAFVDRAVFGRHVWTAAKTWDPEGLVSTLPAIGSQLFGVLTGRFLASERSRRDKTVGLFAGGLVFLAVGALLDRVFMPINKSLWTPSYAVMMTGFGLLTFGFFYGVIDAWSAEDVKAAARKALLPFTIYGMNALFIFALSGLIAKMLGFLKWKAALYAPIKALPLDPKGTSLVFAILFNLFMFTIAWGMWKKKWFVKV